jgi:hypothetical protein
VAGLSTLPSHKNALLMHVMLELGQSMKVEGDLTISYSYSFVSVVAKNRYSPAAPFSFCQP